MAGVALLLQQGVKEGEEGERAEGPEELEAEGLPEAGGHLTQGYVQVCSCFCNFRVSIEG